MERNRDLQAWYHLGRTTGMLEWCLEVMIRDCESNGVNLCVAEIRKLLADIEAFNAEGKLV